MRLNRRTVIASSLALAASGRPRTASAATPTEITDVLGRKVAIRTPVERVVATFNYEEFTAIAGQDAWAKVVGMSRTPWASWRPAIFTRYSATIPNLKGMPDVGYAEDGSFSAEKVIALKPDVLFLPAWSFEALSVARQQIEAAAIPIVCIDYNAQLLDRHLASTRAIGQVMGTSERAEDVARYYEGQYRDILRRVADARSPRSKVYVELGQDGPEAVGNTYNGTMWGKIIDALGAQNIATGRIPGPWGPMNGEAVIAADPDVVLIAGSSWLNKPKAVKTGYDATPAITRASLEPYARRAGWENLAAVRAGEIHALEHGLARTLFDFAAMQYIAKRLYPEAFADVDPVASLRAYHERYLPVTFGGTWMLPLKP